MGTPPPRRRIDTDALRQRSAAGLGSVRGWLAREGFTRPTGERLLGGVLAGLGRRFGVSPWLLRVAFLVSLFLPGPQILLYLVAWVAMPREP